MNSRKILAVIFMAIAAILSILFYSKLELPTNPMGYFGREYFNQIGPIAVAIELFIAGFHLFGKKASANFTLALFAFTALLDPLFNWLGWFQTNMPVYATIIFIICALPALYLAFTDTYGLGKIKIWSAVGSFILGVLIELFFNYW